MFGYSIVYLFALFAILMLDRAPGVLSNFGLTDLLVPGLGG
jgi:hypothetical protein